MNTRARPCVTGGVSAVAVRGDGSLRISWPNGDLAVSCDSKLFAGACGMYPYVTGCDSLCNKHSIIEHVSHYCLPHQERIRRMATGIASLPIIE